MSGLQQRRVDRRERSSAGSEDEQDPSAIYAAAHELRTPLTAILGFAELLRADGLRLDPDESRRMLGHIITNVRAEVRIIDRWLGEMQDEAGQDACPSGFDLRTEADALRADIAPVMDGHLLDFRVADGLRVLGQPDALREVLSNLLMNAVKYSYPGSTITVSAERMRGLVTVVVHSEGEAVAPNVLRRLFEEGYRASPDDAGRLSFGLGLGIARDLVTQLGGRIWAESGTTGTSFKFTLRNAGPALLQPKT